MGRFLDNQEQKQSIKKYSGHVNAAAFFEIETGSSMHKITTEKRFFCKESLDCFTYKLSSVKHIPLRATDLSKKIPINQPKQKL